MKNKKRIIILLTSILIIGIIGFFIGFKVLKTKTNDKEITPLMYEITKKDSNNKIYLFGSIHIANINEISFPKYVMDAYENSKYIACEYDVVESQKNEEKLLEEVEKMIYTDGTTIKDHLSNETYNKLVDFLTKKEAYTSLYDMYKPFFFESLITLLLANDAKINSNTGIDDYFLNKAKEDKKQILEVESSSFQMDLLLGFSDELYEIILNDAIDNYDEEINNLIKLYNAWKKGNVSDLLEISDDDIDIKDSYTEEQIKLINEYNKKIIDDRNIGMTNRLIEYFNNNYDTFYMVGALHLIGNKGIAHLLEQEGFTVKQVNIN